MDYVVRHVIHVDSDEIKYIKPSYISYRSQLFIYLPNNLIFGKQTNAFYIMLSFNEWVCLNEFNECFRYVLNELKIFVSIQKMYARPINDD